MPKKQKPNGFMLFMLDMRPRLEAEGHKFPGGISDVHTACSPLWNNFSSEQKAVFNERAKGVTSKVKIERLDTHGVPISWREKEEQKKVSEKSEIFQKIEDLISYLSTKNELESHNFHLAHFNYAVSTDEGEYPPCEIAIVKYSLLNGISEHYHDFVNPGKLRIGYSYPAKEHAEATHKIPAIGFKLYNSNYIAITDAIKKILRQQDGGIAPLFFLDEDKVKATYILEWLIEKSITLDASYEKCNPFKIYSLNKLFYELRRHANLDDNRLKFTSSAQVADKLCSGIFEFCSNMACKWHDEEDNVKHCSLNYVRSYAYIISDLCCEEYGLALLPNRHCPASIADEDHYTVLPKMARRESATPVNKSENDDDDDNDDDDEPAASVPRLPKSFSRTVEQTVRAVGPRVAANFNGVLPGMGRGILGASTGPKQEVTPPKTSDTPPQVGRGRGRGLLLLSE